MVEFSVVKTTWPCLNQLSSSTGPKISKKAPTFLFGRPKVGQKKSIFLKNSNWPIDLKIHPEMRLIIRLTNFTINRYFAVLGSTSRFL